MRALWLCAGLAVALAAPARGDEPKSYQVPYRLTKTQHILVRAKINGKGPFNFILDTGAPALFVSTAAAKKIGVTPGKDGWGAFDKVRIEGGVPVAPIKGRIEDPFQLEGMNGLGLAGAELHGMIGYNLLARYRIEIDFTKDKMTWTELNFDPPPPKGLDGKAGLPELDALGSGMKLAGSLLKGRGKTEVVARGFLGLELEQGSGLVSVKRVLEKSPADRAGIRPGDRILAFDGKKVGTGAGLLEAAAKLTAGQEVRLTVGRGDKRHEVTIKAGEGL